MAEKATFRNFETSGGARICRLPLEAFPNFWAYVYLILKDDLCVLIDCGSGTDLSHENLLNGLDRAGLQPGELTHILLTHGHIDHFGGLSKLRAITSARIGVHELDMQTVSHHEARLALIGRRLASFLADAGLAEETRHQLLDTYRFTKALYRSVPVDFTYEAVDLRLGPFEIIHLPGHCPGHVAIRIDDAVFCGDMVVEGVTTHLSPEELTPFGGLEHYLDSLDRLRYWSRKARLIFNGHDEVITDFSASVNTARDHLTRRLRQALDALDESRTTAEVCRAIYGDVGGYNALLVIEKTGAYIEYLYEHGMIEIANANEVEQGLPVQYRKLREIADYEILPKQKYSVVE